MLVTVLTWGNYEDECVYSTATISVYVMAMIRDGYCGGGSYPSLTWSAFFFSGNVTDFQILGQEYFFLLSGAINFS